MVMQENIVSLTRQRQGEGLAKSLRAAGDEGKRLCHGLIIKQVDTYTRKQEK